MSQKTDDWVVVFKSTSEYEVDIIRALLLENDIDAQILNEKDSVIDALNVMRETALLVEKSNLHKATQVIKTTDIE